MFNQQLLQIEMETHEYEIIVANVDWSNPASFLNQLPKYVFACCPICLAENTENLDTYSVKLWDLRYHHAVFDSRAIGFHCQHFSLTQPFIHFHNIWPEEASGQFCPEVPHVVGHLLESNLCEAVIHALPVCRIENGKFVPRYTLFIISYFSEQPGKVYDSVIAFNAKHVEPGVAWPFIAPPDGCDHWWDLNHWVEKEQLFWVDANDPELGIRTGDVASFPYGNIEGRTWPYLHTFPYPLPKPKKNNPHKLR